MDLEHFLIRISLNLYMLLQLSCLCCADVFLCGGPQTFVMFELNSLAFASYLWKLMEENLSQTCCKVPGTVRSLELVSLLQAVSTQCLLHFICVYICYILPCYLPECSTL